MQLPYFSVPDLSGTALTLNEDTSKHVVQVLRMEKGARLMLTDGKGKLATAVITDDHRKKCQVQVESVSQEPAAEPSLTIAISLIKNTARFEWFLEKATEIGVTHIIPLICERTEREKFRQERLHGILESAMVQSRQSWMPQLTEPRDFVSAMKDEYAHRFIAYCDEEERTHLRDMEIKGPACILIGPEGDFTKEEILLAIDSGYKPVSLGPTRLRTETAGLVAATLLASARS